VTFELFYRFNQMFDLRFLSKVIQLAFGIRSRETTKHSEQNCDHRSQSIPADFGDELKDTANGFSVRGFYHAISGDNL
jgi:hypothetical protein